MKSLLPLLFVVFAAMQHTTAHAQLQITPLDIGSTAALESVHFLDLDTGYIVGGEEMWKTEDGGLTWTLTSFPFESLTDIYFSKPEVGVASGGGGTIMVTRDAGAEWTRQFNPASQQLSAVLYTGKEWLVSGVRGVMLRSEKAEVPWVQSNAATTRWLNDMAQADTAVVAIVNDGKVVRSVDGGLSWAVASTLRSGTRGVAFFDGENGVAAVSRDVAVTVDGGFNWTFTSAPGRDQLFSIDYADRLHLVAVGGRDILLSTDGGSTWSLAGDSGVRLNDVFLHSNGTGFAVGDNGTVLQLAISGSVATEDEIPSSVALGLSAFPNPARDSVTIQFTTERAGPVRLVVYDQIGREIEVLKEAFMPDGEHQVSWSGASASSGIYFARIQSGDKSQVTKILRSR